jgi:phosphoglycolate phosphatase-like HAD superfamily hydrolase
MNPLSAEIVNQSLRRGPFRAVLFDFDGTLSLIREGWSRLMVGMMLERLREQKLDREPEKELWSHIERLIMAQNGAPTIRQMEVFVEEVQRRGGKPADTEVYLNEFQNRLMAMVQGRWQVLESGQVHPSEWAVPGVHALLSNLKGRGLDLFVASGTEYDHVSREARLLLVNDYFQSGINAPRGNDRSFRKGNVIRKLLSDLNIRGEELLSFGDGMVETIEVKRVGGVAVGVASSEYGSGVGVVNAAKRATLIGAGADIIIPDYAHQEELIDWLWRV